MPMTKLFQFPFCLHSANIIK